MSDGIGSAVAPDPVPVVDHPRLAEALERISDLDARPLTEHHDRLVEVHEVLDQVLHADPGSR
jgi:DNA topoisomerase IB